MSEHQGHLTDVLSGLADQRHGDPSRALRVLSGLAPLEAPLAATAAWVRGVLHHELAHAPEAISAFEQAVDLAVSLGLGDIEARARANLAVTLQQQGHADEASWQIERASSAASPLVRDGFVRYLSTLLVQRQGEHRLAVAGYDAAETALRRCGDRATLGVLILNRGVSFTYLGDYARARAEFAAAESIAEELSLVILGAMAAHNLGFVEGQLGRLAAGLLSLERAAARYESLEERPRQWPVLLTDRAEILLAAGLSDDACRTASEAVAALAATSNIADLTEAELALAGALAASGRHSEAITTATNAARGFRSTGRRSWAFVALLTARRAQHDALPTGLSSDSLARRLHRLAVALERGGRMAQSAEAIALSVIAAPVTNGETALRQLADVRRAALAGSPATRARWHEAHSRATLAEGDYARAQQHLGVAIAGLAGMASASGSTEATLESLRYAAGLARLSVEFGVPVDQPFVLARRVERERATVSRLPRVGMGVGGDLEHALSHLRPTEPPSELAGEPAGVEATIRYRSFLLPANGPLHERMSWTRLRAALGGRALIYYLVASNIAYALVVRNRRTELVTIGDLDELRSELEYSMFSIARLALMRTPRHAPVETRWIRDTRRLDDRFVAPLGLRERSVVIVPAPELGEVPWSVLPRLASRDVVVAPSAMTWLAASNSTPRTGRPLFVGGPRLAAGDHEVETIARCYPSSRLLTGAAARVDDVLAAMNEASVVHIAAHGLLRSDSPMFSSLELVDGPLTVYDLERVPQPPDLVVLSACDAAASHVTRSGGAIGTAAALLRLGVRTVVAPQLPVDDEAACRLMVRFHDHLRSVGTVSTALRLAAQEALASDDPAWQAAAAAFVTIGAD